MDLTHSLMSMKPGQLRQFNSGGQTFTARYHARPSTGDNGKRVSGATVGEFTLEHPGGRVTTHEHGPQANTEQAARRGANPNARVYAAENASRTMATHWQTAKMGFNDRR